MITLQEFKRKVKSLTKENGVKCSVTSDRWIIVKLEAEDELLSTLTGKIQEIAGFQNNSDIMTDYFDFVTEVSNKCGGTYPGLLVSKWCN